METEKINWIDVSEIAIQLNEKFPEVDPQWICLLYTSPSPRD